MIDRAFFLFPGQGAQYPGMALDFLHESEKVKALFSRASEINGKNMEDLLNSSPETLKQTDIAQPAITLANLAAAEFLAEKGIKPAGCAGFSLGEYAAFAAAGIITKEDCLFLVNERGKTMQAAIDKISAAAGSSTEEEQVNKKPGMAAVIGLAPATVEALISEWSQSGLSQLYAANINSPKQVVVSGSAAALEEAEKRFKEAGAKRFLRLQVAGPFHSPFMKDAAEAFAITLEKVRFNDPLIPVYSNVTGKLIKNGTEAKELSVRQIAEAVRWTDEEAAIAKAGNIDCLLETGPGKVLQGLWNDSGNDLPCYPAGTVTDINKLLA